MSAPDDIFILFWFFFLNDDIISCNSTNSIMKKNSTAKNGNKNENAN